MSFKEIEVKHYGCNSKKKDIVIWCPHDGDYFPFFENYPDFYDLLKKNHHPDLISKYFEIERDRGSLYLADKIAESIQRTNCLAAIKIIYTNIPRGILDLARIFPFAKRKIFPKEAHESISFKLENIYSKSMDIFIKEMDDLKQNGIFIDLHTMAPYNPCSKQSTKTEYISESPENLSSYVDAYRFRDANAIERKVDLIVSDKNDVFIADRVLTESISLFLKETNIPFDYNYPFSTDEHLIACHLMKSKRGITIDIPKHYLFSENICSKDFDLSNISLSDDKILKLATVISNALLNSIELENLIFI